MWEIENSLDAEEYSVSVGDLLCDECYRGKKEVASELPRVGHTRC
jgi:hypothetical protein